MAHQNKQKAGGGEVAGVVRREGDVRDVALAGLRKRVNGVHKTPERVFRASFRPDWAMAMLSDRLNAYAGGRQEWLLGLAFGSHAVATVDCGSCVLTLTLVYPISSLHFRFRLVTSWGIFNTIFRSRHGQLSPNKCLYWLRDNGQS
jgi:hypothetical protein